MANKKNIGIRLLKKGKKGILTAIFSRLAIVFALLLIQLLLIFSFFSWFQEYLPQLYFAAILFSITIVMYLLNTNLEASGKITWLIMIMLLPFFGALFFLYSRKNFGHKKLKINTLILAMETQNKIKQEKKILDDLKAKNPAVFALSKYLKKSGCFPVYSNSAVKFFPSGEAKFEELLIQLEKAEKFIFLEYFIIDEGKMWGQILEILVKKAKQGVEVRVMYDGTCEFSTLTHDYPKRLEKLGIKCKVFAPITPFISTHHNYRDHRKILIIDGITAFNGGVNLADEYINECERFGHWKDAAVMVQGEAVKSYILMFLQMWHSQITEEFNYYLNFSKNMDISEKGFIIPYGDTPLDDERVGEQVYIDILNRAQDYVYIMTPYLIIDGELENSLCFAAKRGVDVRILLPGIPDKKIPFALAYTHYKTLLQAGVKIYEYSKGFVHSKTFVADDREAVVGTINLDYRSLYHNFECATYMYEIDCIREIKKEFIETLLNCRNIRLDNMYEEKISRRITGFLLKGISPLL